MIYAIASGKGGTGKTTVTASLSVLWGSPVTAVDLDVEEPNLHLFLKPDNLESMTASMEVPVADVSRCSLCGRCSDLCQFKAIAVMGPSLLIFPEMCHGCGGCLAICPERALLPGKRELGEVLTGKAGDHNFAMGRLRVGEAMSPPLMGRVMQAVAPHVLMRDVLIDAPPGVSCPAVSAVSHADCIVLVTEPTPFGLHDFKLAVEAFTPFGKPMGAVINRADVGNCSVHDHCQAHGIPIWAELPYDRTVAEAYSRGDQPVLTVPGFRRPIELLRDSMQQATREVSHA